MKRFNKRLISLLLALVMVFGMMPLTSFTAEAAEETTETVVVCDEAPSNFEYTVDDDAQTVTLTKYIGTEAAVVVADRYTVDGADYATVLDCSSVFTGNKMITSVTVGSGVSFKDNSMAFLFYQCHKLVRVDMTGVDTSKVTTMESLFDECKKLTTITGYEEWDTGSLASMFHTFDQTHSLTTVDLSGWDLSMVENTGWCFQQCYATEIKLPDNLKTISAGFLNHASKITGSSFTIPAGVKKIGYAHTIYNFATNDFVEFIVAEGNTNYKAVDGILYSADGTEMLAVPRNKTFENNTYEIPDGVTFLGELSFSRNYNIHTMVLPDSFVIEYVPLNDPRYIVFEDIGNINAGTNLSIAIYCYTGITEYAVKDSNPNYASLNGILYSKDMTEVVAIPARYAQELVIPEGVTAWNMEAMWADTDNNASSTLIGLLKSCPGVSIPASLTSISEDQLSMLNLLYTSRKGTTNPFTITIAEGNTAFELDETEGLVVKKHEHSYASTTTAPTCTEQGYTTYTCDCGDSYVSDYVDAYGLHDVDTDKLYNVITVRSGQLDSDTDGMILDSDIYGFVVNYPLKKGHVLSISNMDYVFSVRKLENGSYSTLLRSATSDSYTATEDVTVAMLIRKADKSAVTAEELASIVVYDSQYGMIGVEGSVNRFTVEAETIDGGTATTRAAIFLPDSYSEYGAATRLIIMTNGLHGYLTDTVWNANTADDVGVMKHYLDNDYAVIIVNNTADRVNGAPDWGNPQLVDSYWKAYEYVQAHFNVEELFSIHSRSMGTFAATRLMREHPELVKCAVMCGAVLSLQSRFSTGPAHIAARYGFDDTTGATWEADKVVGYDPYTDVNGMEYDLPPTFWMLAEADATTAHLSVIDKIKEHGNDVTQAIYTDTDHSGVCRLNTDACKADSLAFLEKYQDAEPEHRFCAWETVAEATCTESGEMRRYCADCSHYETMEIPALSGHVFETCETVCDICGARFDVTSAEIALTPGQFYNESGEWLASDIYGCVIGYELKAGHTLSISDTDYVFAVRVLIDGSYTTMVKEATAEEFTAEEDMIIAVRVRKPDKSALTEEELAAIVLIDTCRVPHTHTYSNGICTLCGGSVLAGGYTAAVPENQGVQNAIDRAYALTDVEWTPVADVPGVQKIDGVYTVITFEAGKTYKGIPYSGVTANDCYVGLNVSLESYLTALENQNSVLYTENLNSTNKKSATYYGTVCSKFVQYALNVPGSYNTNNVANIPGMQTIALPGEYTVDQIRLGDVIVNTATHTTICTGILYDAEGNVAFIEVSEAVSPLCRRLYWSVEEFYEHFAQYRLCRYDYIGETPAVEETQVEDSYALMPRFGDKYNYKVSSTKGVVDILESGYHKAVILRDGVVIDEIILNGATSFKFDRSVPGYLEMYLEREDGTRSGSVYACVVKSSVSVADASRFVLGKLTVDIDGSCGTPLYVQVGSAHAIFCNVEGQEGTVEITFPFSKVSSQKVRVAYQNEYGIYLSSWVSFTAEENPSDDPLLSQGKYWNGYNITPSSPTPVVQENKVGYWSYTMIPVEANTTYYSVGATRMWFLDANGDPISTYNAYKDSDIPFQFTTPAGTAYVNIAYSPNLVEQGTETLVHVHTYESGTCIECGHWNGPVITRQPESIQAALGEQFSVTVEAEGEGLTYQWYYKHKNSDAFTVSSFKRSAYAMTMATYCHNREIYCVITDANGNSVQTETVLITAPLTVTKQPTDVQVEIGERFSIGVQALGDGLTYQWYYKSRSADAFTISSFKGKSYSMTMREYCHERQVYCVITDQYGNSVTTDTVTITRPPVELVILEQPQDVQVEIGQLAEITVAVQGEGLTYQWYYKNAGGKSFVQSGFNGDSYPMVMREFCHNRQVYCVITDQYGNSVTTETATMSRPPVELKILEQSADVYAAMGEKFSVSFAVQGEGLTYQWYYKDASARDFKISSFNGSTYSMTMAGFQNGRQVYCVITDRYGNQVTTEVATIHLN